MRNWVIMIIMAVIVMSCAPLKPMQEIKNADPDLIPIITGCTAGILSNYKLQADVNFDLNKAVKEKKLSIGITSEVNDWVKGYIFEKIPSNDALEAYKLYLECYGAERKRFENERQVGIDPKISKLKEESQHLWNEWEENNKYARHLFVNESKKYAMVGINLKNINGSDLMNTKSRIMKYDREALIFFIASEIIIRSKDTSDYESYIKDALEYSENSVSAAQSAREEYKSMIQKEITPNEREWLTREDIDLVTLDRLSESLAQIIFLGKQEYSGKIDETLKFLPCNYIRNYKFIDNIVYKRIGIPKRIVECQNI